MSFILLGHPFTPGPSSIPELVIPAGQAIGSGTMLSPPRRAVNYLTVTPFALDPILPRGIFPLAVTTPWLGMGHCGSLLRLLFLFLTTLRSLIFSLCRLLFFFLCVRCLCGSGRLCWRVLPLLGAISQV